jgi:membrane-associated phospholipid phosphatase
VRRIVAPIAFTVIACGVARPVRSQTGAETPPAAGAPSSPAAESEHGGTMRFIRDVGADHRNFLSRDTAVWLGNGLAAALDVHAGDLTLAEQAGADGSFEMRGGHTYGLPSVQFPLAVGWWIVGHYAGSERGAEAGRDLLRAQVSALTWTYALKYTAHRTRPNGDPRSFPSGHASSTFATAAVLCAHYGSKVGVPAFAIASYTAASRVVDNKHWASDVVFGAVLGMTTARTVTIRLRETTISLAPMALPGGGVLVNVR